MSEYIEVGQPLQFTDPNTPTRAGEIVENVSDIYNIPSPRLGMQVFVKSEKKTYTITGLKETVIGGERVPDAKVDTFEAVKSQVEEINNDFAEMQEALINGSFVVGIAKAVKAGAVTFEMLDGKLQLSASVVDDLETDDALKPLSANQGKVLKELIDIINGTGKGSTDKKITDAIAKLVDNAPENLDTLKELAEWIKDHGTEAAEMLAAINANTTAIKTEAKRATEAESDIKVTAISKDGLEAYPTSSTLELAYKTLTGEEKAAELPPATNKTAGVMRASDKVKLDASIKNIDVSPNTDDVELDLEDNTDKTTHITIPAATTESAGVMSAEDKVKLYKADNNSKAESFRTTAIVENSGLFYKSVNDVFFPIESIGTAVHLIAIGDMPAGNYDVLIQFADAISKDMYAKFTDSEGNPAGLAYIGDITSSNTLQDKDRIVKNFDTFKSYTDVYIKLSTNYAWQVAGKPISVTIIQRENIKEHIANAITKAEQSIAAETERAQAAEKVFAEDTHQLFVRNGVASAIAKATFNELGGDADIIETIYIPRDAIGSKIWRLPLNVVAGKRYGVNIMLSRAIKDGSEVNVRFVNNEQDEKSVWLPTLKAGTETFTSNAISLDSLNTDTAYLRIETGLASHLAGYTITVIVADYDGMFANGRLNKLEEIVNNLKLDSIKTKIVLDELGGKIDAIDNWTVVPVVNENNNYSTAHLTPVTLKEGATYNATVIFPEPIPAGIELIMKLVDAEGNVTKWGKSHYSDGLTSVFYMFNTPHTINEDVARSTTHIQIQYNSLKLQGYDIAVILAEGGGVFSNGRFNTLESNINELKNRVDDLEISKKTLKVLCIGNSFTQDAMGYVPYIMKNVAPDVDLTLGIAYIGGSPLAWHLANLIGETVTVADKSYSPQKYEIYSKSVNGDKWAATFNKDIDSIIKDDDWDIITFQQSGGTSGQDYDIHYAPFIHSVLKKVSSMVVKPVKFGWLSVHGTYNTTAELNLRHYERTVANTQKVVDDTSIDVVFPYGTAVQNLRTIADLNTIGNYEYGFMQVDSGHLQNGIGCLCASYACALKLLEIIGEARGVMGDTLIVDNTFMKDNNIPGPNPQPVDGDYAVLGMTDRNRYLAQIAAVQATKKPYEVTDINKCDV